MLRRKLLALALMAVLAGCADEPKAVTPLTLDYARYGKIELAVGKIEFVNRAKLSAARDMEYFQNYKPQLADSIYRWGVDRLQATGKEGRAVLLIRDATREHEMLPQSTGVSSWFTREIGEKWIGRAAVDIQVREAAGFNGVASATVTRTVTLPEQATAAEKEAAYRRMLLGMMDDFNAQIPQAIREHLNSVVQTMP